ncbi:lactonase family protein [Akkermansiaceae bacterium]|nr:lactonase family protein [Akkermansiaceae bacterium]
MVEGKFTEISSQPYEGRGLCHVSIDANEKVLFGADYGGGKVVSFPIEGGEIGAVASLMQHKGSSLNKQRQEGPHAHSIYAGPDNKFAYAPDLGIDQVKFYAFDAKGTLTDKGGFKLIPGSGPRHMKFGKDGSHAYVLNELTLTVTGFSRDTENGVLTMKNTVSVFPSKTKTENMSCSEIRVSQDGKFIYTANRDLTEEGRDSLTVLSVAQDGSLKHLETTPAAVWIPRNINLSPSGDWLLVAGQKSNEVTSHRIDKKTGKISFSGKSAEVPKAMCINFAR